MSAISETYTRAHNILVLYQMFPSQQVKRNVIIKIVIACFLETTRLLVNHQLISIAIQPKSVSLEQICYKRSQGIAVTSLHCLLFSTSKKSDLKRISKSASNVVLALKFLWTSKFIFP